MAVVRIDSALRLSQSVGIGVEVRQIRFQRTFRRFLHIQIQRRVNLQAFFIKRFRIILVTNQLLDVADEIGSAGTANLFQTFR